jgi:hypothetical protein
MSFVWPSSGPTTTHTPMFRPSKSLLLPLLLIPLAAAFPAQDDGLTKDERRAVQLETLQKAKEEATRKRLVENVQTLRQMQGTWQMMEYTAGDLPDEGRHSTGFVVVAGEFLSLEVHMIYFDEDGAEDSSFIQTGTYRLNFNTFSQLLATCLIGSIDDGTGLTAWQLPGEISVHTVDIKGDVMKFIAEDGAKMTLERVKTGRLSNLVYEEVDWLPGAEEREAKSAALEAAAREPSAGDE